MRHSPKKSSEHGVTIPMLALFIVVLFTFAALAVDVGVLYTARTSAQHAADAAALAGAATFLNSTASQPAAALNAAIAVAAQNTVLGRAVTIAAENIVVDPTNRRVTVTVPRTGANGVQTFFANALGIKSVNVATVATAEASDRGSASRCIKPVFMPNTMLSDLPTANEACHPAAGTPQIIFDPETHDFSAWFKANQASFLGKEITLREYRGSGPLAPSQYYSLDFGAGANTYRCAWAQCLNDCPSANLDEIACGMPYPVETGGMTGPTVQGVKELIDAPQQDTWAGLDDNNQYTFHLGGSGGPLSTSSRSVVVIPIWDSCTETVTPGTHGQKVKVVGFLNVFIVDAGGQNVTARLMDWTECPPGGSGVSNGETGPATGPLAIPVHLVQTTAQ